MSASAAAEVGAQQEQPPRSWHGHLLNPFGSCDALGWSTCLVTHYCPAVSFALTNRRAFSTSALRAFIIFATLVVLSVLQRSFWISLSANECLAELPPSEYGSPRRLGPAFGAPDGAFSMTDVRARAAKPFGRPIDAGKVDSELCHRLVHTSMWLNVATIIYTAYIIVLGARLRTAMRERFGIEGSRFKDVVAWLCCMPCAMCQEARTMAANNVQYGVWHGPVDGMPIYSAAAMTESPSVPVMSAEPLKPAKV
jgi:Cys-rich protein (TIGR01571 family)